jgi:hypothetical protein
VTLQPPSPDDLGRLAVARGVEPSDADLEGVRAFLEVLLPALEEIERSLPQDAVPTGIPPA